MGEGARHQTPHILPSDACWRDVRRWVRERITRRRNYSLVAESGLFDATWYRSAIPMWAAGVDPLVHYLKWRRA